MSNTIKNKFSQSVVILLIGILGVTSSGGGSAIAKTKNIGDEQGKRIIVKFKEGVSETLKTEKHRRYNGALRETVQRLNAEVVEVAAGDETAALESYQKDEDVLYAEPDYVAEAFGVTNDPSLPQQWGMFKIEAANGSGESAWDLVTSNSSVKVAILDTGIEETHSDIAGKVAVSQNFTTSNTTSDRDGHGTHVAGIAAASTNNSLGVAGVGYNSSLMNGKVLADNGSGYYSWIANGIIWATDNGANVINMSLGGSSGSQTLLNAVNYAWNNGVVVVAAAGNSSTSAPSYPAYYGNTIAVAATDSNDQKAGFSNYGSWVDVAAPGVSIYSTYKNNSYASLSGTSMASPYVAGLAGLIWASGLCATNTCVRGQVESTADNISGTGSLWTYGRINAYRAVGGTPPPPPPPPPAATMTVSAIDMWFVHVGGGRKQSHDVYAKVTVVDGASAPLPGATVYLAITLPSGATASGSATTLSDGTVTFRLRSKEHDTYVSNVTNAAKSGYQYNPTLTTQSLIVN